MLHLNNLYPGFATIDPLGDKAFPCYFTRAPISWNGFACPYFPAEVAKAMLEDLSKVEDAGSSRIEPDGTFVTIDPNYPPDQQESRWEAEVVERDGEEPFPLYPVGSWAWCWVEEKPPSSAGQN
jgi:hypothetical protein